MRVAFEGLFYKNLEKKKKSSSIHPSIHHTWLVLQGPVSSPIP